MEPGVRINDQTLNRLTVLKALRGDRLVSRRDLPGMTGLSAGTITQVTSELLRRDLIVETREEGRRAGRPRQFLQLNGDGAIVMGASQDWKGGMAVVFVDLCGNLLRSQTLTLSAMQSLEGMGSQIALALEKAIADSPFPRERIDRIGIALPAVIDARRGAIHFMVTFPSGPVAIAQGIEDRLGLPVTLENDMVCMIRAEHWFGRARDRDTFTMVHVAHALGLAQYVDGMPRHGANGFNAEISHVKTGTDAAARQCLCGARGCLLTYASIYGILSSLGGVPSADLFNIEALDAAFEAALDRAEAGDSQAAEAIALAGRHLGLALANHINTCDPGFVLVSVHNQRFIDHIARTLHEALEAYTLPALLRATEIRLVVADNDWRWKGTGALALEQAFLSSR